MLNVSHQTLVELRNNLIECNHVQFYLEKRVPLWACKDHDSDSNSDGWAEYGKYILLGEIYGLQNPIYRYVTLQEKPIMIVCSIVASEIHLRIRTLEEAADWLVKKSAVLTRIFQVCWTGRYTIRLI